MVLIKNGLISREMFSQLQLVKGLVIRNVYIFQIDRKIDIKTLFKHANLADFLRGVKVYKMDIVK